jgi:hypothetical protein
LASLSLLCNGCVASSFGTGRFVFASLLDAKEFAVVGNHAETLRRAIESLINAKLHDAITPGGIDRLAAHRRTGVASYDIRMAERRLEQAIGEILSGAEVLQTQDA